MTPASAQCDGRWYNRGIGGPRGLKIDALAVQKPVRLAFRVQANDGPCRPRRSDERAMPARAGANDTSPSARAAPDGPPRPAAGAPARPATRRRVPGPRHRIATMASLHPSFSRMVEDSLNGRDKVSYLDWLALIRIETSVRYPLSVRGHHRRGHGHDGNPSSGLLGSQPSERLDAVDPGEPNVHQDQARMSLLGEADALFPRLGLDDRVALERQHVPDELAVLVVVLDDEDQFIRHDVPGS